MTDNFTLWTDYKTLLEILKFTEEYPEEEEVMVHNDTEIYSSLYGKASK